MCKSARVFSVGRDSPKYREQFLQCSLIILRPRKKSKFSNADPPDGKQSDGRGPGCKGSQSHWTGRKAGFGLSTRHKDLRIPAYCKQESSKSTIIC
jgi:hypothetical protein